MSIKNSTGPVTCVGLTKLLTPKALTITISLLRRKKKESLLYTAYYFPVAKQSQSVLCRKLLNMTLSCFCDTGLSPESSF